MPWSVKLKQTPGPVTVEHTIDDAGAWQWSEVPPTLRPALLSELTGQVMDLVKILEALGWLGCEVEKS